MPILQQCWELARVKTSGHSRPIMLQCVSLLPSIHGSWPTKRPIVSLPENASVVLNNFPTSKYLEGWTLVRYFLEFVSPSSIFHGSMHQLPFVKYKHLCIYKDFFLEQVAVRNLLLILEKILNPMLMETEGRPWNKLLTFPVSMKNSVHWDTKVAATEGIHFIKKT